MYFIGNQLKKAKCVWSNGPNLGQISPMFRKTKKKLVLSINFFHILQEEYVQKQEVVVIEISEWKFKTHIARNTTFEEN